MDNKKYQTFDIVLNAKKESTNPLQELVQYCDLLCGSYKSFVATIIHNQDHLDNGELKTIHAHAVIDTPSKSTEKQVLTMLTNLLQVNANQVQINGSNNDYLPVQYLTHKNQPNKTQYEFNLIKTNQEAMLQARYEQDYISKEERQLHLEMDLIESRTLLDFMKKQGVEIANKYRNLFIDIKKEQRVTLEGLYYALNQAEEFKKKLVEALSRYTRQDGFIEAQIIENLIHMYDI